MTKFAVDEKSGPGGVFDKKPREAFVPEKEDPAIVPASGGSKPPPENFKDVFAMQKDQVTEREVSNKKPLGELLGQSDNAAERTAAAVGGKNVQKEIDEMEKFSPKDLELAEQVIFQGYAEFDIPMSQLPNILLTICSTSAEDISMIDEIIYDMVQKATQEDGTVNLPQNHVQALKNGLFVALSYKGKNREELMKEVRCKLTTIKGAIVRVTQLYNAGKIDEAEKLKKSLKEAMIERAAAINRMPTPFIDFLSGEKWRFDDRMAAIMSSKEILPKS